MRLKLVFSALAVLLICGSFRDQKPKILIIGDSISLGYTPFVKSTLADQATVIHCKGNAEYSAYGLSKLDSWLGDEHWDVIQFNWGLWDICYRDQSKPVTYNNRDKIHGQITTTKADYAKNLQEAINRLKQTKAKLIFVTTTCVPDDEAGRYDKDVQEYNAIAIKIMKKNNIPVNDLYPLSKSVHQTDGLGTPGNGNVHYKDSGYQKLAKKVDEGLLNLFKN